MTALPIMTSSQQGTAMGRLETPQGNLPLAAVDVRTTITGLAAATTLMQVFRNGASEPLEATYIFPLPERAAVTRFTARIGDRTIEGVLKERGQARAEYAEAVADGRRAAIAEQERSDVFSIRVGNIAPGERVEIELELMGPLSIDGNEATFRFPLVVAPKYIPGTPMDGSDVGLGVAADTDLVPDASRITPPVLLPGQHSPVRLSLEVDIDAAGLAVHDLASSLHAVTEENSGGRTLVRLLPGDRLDRDFVLRFRVGAAQLQTTAMVTPDGEGGESTLTVTIVPPDANPEARQRPRDVVVLLDRSGSMTGWKMRAASRAASRIVDALTSADRVAVLAFDHEVTTDAAAARLSPATDRHRFDATTFLSQLDARGGTEMLAALDRAAALLGRPDPQRRRVLVLVTDGHVGDEDRIAAVMRATLADTTLHVVGIDQVVSGGILTRLAGMGSGEGHAEMVESQDRLDTALDRIRNRIDEPTLRDIAVDVEGADLVDGSVVPAGRISCPAGVPVVIRARVRCHGEAPVRVRLHGTDAAGRSWTDAQTARDGAAAADAALWAREHLWHLEDRWLTDQGDRSALQQRMTAQSLRFAVLCRFTAFVAVDPDGRVGNGAPVQVVQPVEAPGGWDIDAMAAGMAAPMAPPPGALACSVSVGVGRSALGFSLAETELMLGRRRSPTIRLSCWTGSSGSSSLLRWLRRRGTVRRCGRLSATWSGWWHGWRSSRSVGSPQTAVCPGWPVPCGP